MNYDSIVNQQIKSKFVDREVMALMTDFAEYVIRRNYDGEDDDAPFSNDDIENYYTKKCDACCGTSAERFDNYVPKEPIEKNEDGRKSYCCPICGMEYEVSEDEDIPDCIERAKLCCQPDEDDDDVYHCLDCGKVFSQDEYDYLDDEPQEVYEWWMVTTWFGEKLKAHGEVVIELYGRTLWGRCCTGQAILLDYVVGRICEEMEILEGQAYDWSKK